MRELIVLETYYKMSLPIIRSLGKRGINVHAVDFISRKHSSQGMYSRYVKSRNYIEEPSNNELKFKADLIKIGDKVAKESGFKPVLIIVGAKSLNAVMKDRALFEESFDFLLPDQYSNTLVQNKRELGILSEKLDLNYPKIFNLFPENFKVNSLDFSNYKKIIVKYENSEDISIKKGVKAADRYKIIDNLADLKIFYNIMKTEGQEPIIQECINGKAYGVSVLFSKKSEPLAIFCHERLREYPISGGPSSCAKSVVLEDKIAHSIKLLKHLKWVGFAMVEFKGDYIIEINPRIWGSFSLSYYSNCDMPYAYYSYFDNNSELPNLKDSDYKALIKYRIGRKLKFPINDILAIFAYFKANPSIKSFWKLLFDIVQPAKLGDFELSDIKPFFKSILFKLKALINKV